MAYCGGIKFIEKLPDRQTLLERYALSETQREERAAWIHEICGVLDGADRRKILIVGPCSADREDAVLEYMAKLAALRERVRERFVIVPRVFTGKPRTDGTGYKGLLHRPDLSSGADDLAGGLAAARRLHWRVICETGMFGADEMLYPEVFWDYSDLLCYATVGARSVEDQQHRLAASGLDVPVGMKNPTCGDLNVLLNAIASARHANDLFFNGWVARTEGNPHAHAILRGYEDASGALYPNYRYEELCRLRELFNTFHIERESVVVDCNHSNSGKHWDRQIPIAEEVFRSCAGDRSINGFVKGLMIESYLEDGGQSAVGGCCGKSITDPCLGWDKTEKLILRLAEIPL